ncbi:MAG: flagellar M-ring protein FliF C-terminal domain-containing protein, partial [Phenylobacterium sp.]
QDGFAGAAADDRKSEIEQRIAKTVKSLVEGVVGPGNSRVNVTAELDLAKVTVQQETFDPDGQVVRSEQTVEETAAENQADENGAVSASANIPGGVGDFGQATNSSNSGRSESTTNYEISKTLRTEVKEPGEVKRLSVAVAVDGVVTPGPNGQPGEYAPRSAEEMQRIEQLVRTAVGFDPDRGDQVTVVNVRFPTPAEAGGVEAANPLLDFDKNDIIRAVELAVLGLVALLMIFFVARPLVKGVTSPGQPAGGLLAASTPQGGGQRLVPAAEPAENLALAGPEQESGIDIARIEGQVKASSVKRVAEFVDRHPEESVSILRGWLHDTA